MRSKRSSPPPSGCSSAKAWSGRRIDTLRAVNLGSAAILALVSALGVCACATQATASAATTAPTRPGVCKIADVSWQGVDEDYDHAATIDALTMLETILRDASKAGPDELARRFDTLYRKPPAAALVSKWAVDVAVRLRQLACAEQLHTINHEVANQRYVESIVDLEDERAVIIDEMRRSAR